MDKNDDTVSNSAPKLDSIPYELSENNFDNLVEYAAEYAATTSRDYYNYLPNTDAFYADNCDKRTAAQQRLYNSRL